MAMAIVDDDMKEDSVYSLLLDSLNSNTSGGAFSPDDVAWVDSCFNKDLGSSDADWSAVKDALLEIFISQPEPPSFAAAESSWEPTDDEVLRSGENAKRPGFGRVSDEDEDLIDDEIEEVENIDVSEDEEEDVMGINIGRVKRKKRVQNVFRPNYSEAISTVEKVDSGLDLGLTANDVEPSTEDIFKVWDLGISDEQDDFTNQLDKALAYVPPETESTADDSTSYKDLMNVSVDDLIAGIDGLSLTQNTN